MTTPPTAYATPLSDPRNLLGNTPIYAFNSGKMKRFGPDGKATDVEDVDIMKLSGLDTNAIDVECKKMDLDDDDCLRVSLILDNKGKLVNKFEELALIKETQKLNPLVAYNILIKLGFPVIAENKFDHTESTVKKKVAEIFSDELATADAARTGKINAIIAAAINKLQIIMKIWNHNRREFAKKDAFSPEVTTIAYDKAPLFARNLGLSAATVNDRSVTLKDYGMSRWQASLPFAAPPSPYMGQVPGVSFFPGMITPDMMKAQVLTFRKMSGGAGRKSGKSRAMPPIHKGGNFIDAYQTTSGVAVMRKFWENIQAQLKQYGKTVDARTKEAIETQLNSIQYGETKIAVFLSQLEKYRDLNAKLPNPNDVKQIDYDTIGRDLEDYRKLLETQKTKEGNVFQLLIGVHQAANGIVLTAAPTMSPFSR